MLLTRSPLSWSRSPNRVRLACVRHAASVDSEPGSNSHVKFAVWPRLAPQPRNCLTRAPVDWLLRCFVLVLCVVVNHALTLDGRPPKRVAAPQWTYVMCLHALSSFQRTGFARPLRVRAVALPAGPRAPSERPFPSVSGEPSEVTCRPFSCQASFLAVAGCESVA